VKNNTDICGIVRLNLNFMLTCEPELDFLKQNWDMSAEWNTLHSLRPSLSCTEICVKSNTDIYGIVRLQLTFMLTCEPELDFLKQNWVMSAE
jgi:hypothetical protein